MKQSSTTEDAVHTLACRIHQRGFATPAIFLFEMSKPLIGCFRQLYTCSVPIQIALCGRELMAELKEVLESSDEVERLIVLLERFRDESADDRLKKQRQEQKSDCSLRDCAPNDAIRFKASAAHLSVVTDLAFSLGEQARSLEFGSGVSSIDSSEVDT
jgi:hypothetical protein